MAVEKKVAVLVGSLRKESFTRKLAQALIKLAPPELEPKIIEIGRMPFYNQDLETAPPEPWVEFRQAIRESDAVLFVTPEYNRSVPAALKNALDVGSRPHGRSVWSGKPGAIVSDSPGALGAFGANHHLRQSLVFLNVPAMHQPEAYVGGVDKLFDEKGDLKNEESAKFLKGFMDAFARWVTANGSAQGGET
jgi:chromate reductase, NAD(P)H dehydrogenase (quinone)